MIACCDGIDHNVGTIPIKKLDGGTIGYRWACSCGREGKGYHNTEVQAMRAAGDHIR